MQLIALGKITVAVPGTPTPITAAMIAAAGGELPPSGGVAQIEVRSADGNAGATYVKHSSGAVIAPLLSPFNGQCPAWRARTPKGANTLNPLSFQIDADHAGDGAYVSIWVE